MRYTLLGCIMLISAFSGCHYANRYFGLKDDHPLEEFVERAIKTELGVDIDLTPETPE